MQYRRTHARMNARMHERTHAPPKAWGSQVVALHVPYLGLKEVGEEFHDSNACYNIKHDSI